MGKPKITSVSWPSTANLGESVAITVTLEGNDSQPVDVIVRIEEYDGPGRNTTFVEQLEASQVTSPSVTLYWTATAAQEGGIRAGLPEYRAVACLQPKGKEKPKTAKDLLTFGSVKVEYWANPKGLVVEPRSTKADKIQSYFKNEEKVDLVVEVQNLQGFDVVFYVTGENSLGEAFALPAQTVKIQNGKAVLPFQLDSTKAEPWKKYAWSKFRFTYEIVGGGVTYQSKDWKSGFACHCSTILGFYGAGPTGKGSSNIVLLDIGAQLDKIGPDKTFVFDAVEEILATTLKLTSLQRLADRVAPEETEMRLFGYSRGGVAANHFAQLLEKRKINVKAMLGIDPVKVFGADLRGKLQVPPNVNQVFNYVQLKGATILPHPVDKGDLYYRKGNTFEGISTFLVYSKNDIQNGMETAKWDDWKKSGFTKSIDIVNGTHKGTFKTLHDTMPSIVLEMEWYKKLFP
jgi:hypothetical protein